MQTLIVDGIERPLHNNQGQLIHDTTEGITNFWRWFKDSQVIDAAGRPIVVYHGTGAKFTKVNIKKGNQPIFWVTSNLDAITSRNIGAQGFGQVLALYAKIASPANWKQYDNLLLDEFSGRGLDGAILGSDNCQHFEAFIMNPNQIKSANKNSGAFNANDDSMIDKVVKSKIK